jgi:acyl transferase domain-containing protein/aryl carrier-like protein/acyl carrier protein
MDVKAVVQQVLDAGIALYLKDGKLAYKAKRGAFTEPLQVLVREHKGEIEQYISAQAAALGETAAPLSPVAVQDRGILSFAQQRLWFLDQLGHGSAHYNMPAALRLAGALDRQALHATLNEIIRRHEVLRTTYHKTAVGGVQHVASSLPVSLPVSDWSDVQEDEQVARIGALMLHEQSTTFDLARDPMIRVSLARLSADSHILFLTLHHIAADGWSLGILVREFADLYQAFVEGREPALPQLPIQYADYAHWQRNAVSSELTQKHLAFWRDELAGVAQLHNIPTNRLRDPQQATAGKCVYQVVDAPLLADLVALGSRHGASLFMVLHAAFAVLLARWSGDEDIVVGTPVAGRDHKDIEHLIGCFVNTLALRSRVKPGLSFDQFLRQSRASTLRAYAHQKIPFDMVVESLNPPRSLSHSPLFQVMFALQNYDMGALALPGLTVEELVSGPQNTKFDIAVIAIESEGALRLSWTFVDGLFELSTMQSMASSYLNLLQAIVADPAQHIDRLPLLSAEQAAGMHEAARARRGYLVRDALGAIQPQGAAGRVSGAQAGQAAGGSEWHDTGDIGFLRSNGDITILRHERDNETLNGHRVAIKAVEAALLETGLPESAVVRMLKYGEAEAPALVAYVVPCADDRSGFTDACLEALRARVPDFMLPAVFVVVEALPLMADGTIDVARLPVPVLPIAAVATHTPPSHALEQQLCEIWCLALSLESVGIHDSFFDVGGTSLHSIIVQQEILNRTGLNIDVTDLFTYPTIAGLAKYLQHRQREGERDSEEADTGLERDRAELSAAENGRYSPSGAIAIIGMAGRFPGARDVDAFWENIKNGRESLTVFTDEELLAEGVAPELLADPAYVKSGVVLEGIREFDAAYFGFTPREAEVMDPQQRLLFECAVEALEQAGYGDDAMARPVGVYVGTGESHYLFENLLPQSALLETLRIAAMHGTRPDFMATRLSHRLNLAGPSLSVGTACSTSLVAVHEACQSLLAGECEMALAGGASISQLGPRGYLYQEGFITSPDGHCRAFDKDAAGTRSGSGAALVLLKRLEDALADGDTIHAVIRGSAINNDGADKVGYTAPSVQGQARAIARAQAVAGVAADSIGYVETHGTGTSLGDPIEIRALSRSFAGAAVQSCALGAVKPNIGHLDSAAGVAGLIKTVKVLSERQIPPTVNFKQPNPQIDFDNSPFYVSKELKHWHSGATPRRAGVSSFGIGGTNAHVVLEEAPAIEPGHGYRKHHLVLLSAKTPSALARMSSDLAQWMDAHGDGELADVAYTLQRGRTAHGHRLAFVADTVPDAAQALAEDGGARMLASAEETVDEASVVFMFTGQGSQYVGMGSGLYRVEPLFRDMVDTCADLLVPHLGLDLRQVMFAAASDPLAQDAMARTDLAQVALFVFEYALARQWMAWGLQPAAMVGHSLGEYVAACLAGVFSLEDGLKLVAARGRLMQLAEPGNMLSVRLGEEAARALALEWSCELAAVNGAADCVISGPRDAIDALAAHLDQRDVSCRVLRTSHAFHSRMMTHAAVQLGDLVQSIPLSAPALPYVSNVTGRFIEAAEATNPNYWIRHLVGTVRFADGLETLFADTSVLRRKRLMLEVGPGITLTSLMRKQARVPDVVAIASGRHLHDERDDDAVVLAALGQLWVHGAAVDWRGFHAGEQRRRIPLPAYPFERQRYWIDALKDVTHPDTTKKAARVEGGFHVPTWTQAPALPPAPTDDRSLWLIFADEGSLAVLLRERLAVGHARVVTVSRGSAFMQEGEGAYRIDPGSEQDYRRLTDVLAMHKPEQLRVLHLWSTDGADVVDLLDRTEHAEIMAFGSLLYLGRACDAVMPQVRVELNVVTRNVFSVTGGETMAPEFAIAPGLGKVIAQEYPQFRTAHVDLASPAKDDADLERMADQLLAECAAAERPAHVAYRGRKRWLQRNERLLISRSGRPTIRKGGTYLITGGMGLIGLQLAQELARQGAGALVLVGRSAWPPRESWATLHTAGSSAQAGILKTLLAIEALGAKVSIQRADVASLEQMQRVISETEDAFGAIHGVIHGAGKVHDALRPLDGIGLDDRREHFQPKIAGTQVLDKVLVGRELDFCLLMSSLSSVLGGLGFGAYAAANSYLDAYAQWKHHQGDTAWLAVNWDAWRFTDSSAADRLGMSVKEGIAALDLILGAAPMPQVISSAGDLATRSGTWLQPADDAPVLASAHARPTMHTAFAGPRNAQETRLASIWQEMLGFTEVGIHDNFFELGGDSVLITRLLARIRSFPEFDGVNLTIKHLFEMPTVAQLSTWVDDVRQAAELAMKSESLRARSKTVEMGEI